jgi:hypothetical protein
VKFGLKSHLRGQSTGMRCLAWIIFGALKVMIVVLGPRMPICPPVNKPELFNCFITVKTTLIFNTISVLSNVMAFQIPIIIKSCTFCQLAYGVVSANSFFFFSFLESVILTPTSLTCTSLMAASVAFEGNQRQSYT